MKLLRQASGMWHSSGSEAYVVAGEVVDGGLGEHAVVCQGKLVVKHGEGLRMDIHSSSDLRKGGVLPAMMMSFALPERRVLRVDL